MNKPLILVVDDDRTIRALLTLAMEEEGYQVVEAKNGQQCLDEFLRCQPDMVLLDAVMPEMDGFTCCQRLRAFPKGGSIPVLMITVLDDQESVNRAFNAGATDYVTKPISWPVLSQRVKRLLAASQATLAAQQARIQISQIQEWDDFLREMTYGLCSPFTLRDFLVGFLGDLRIFAQVDRVYLYHLHSNTVFEPLGEDNCPLGDLTVDYIAWLNTYLEETAPDELVALDYLDDVPNILDSLKTQAVLLVPIYFLDDFWGWLTLHQCSSPRPWSSFIPLYKLFDLCSLIAVSICYGKD